MANTTIRARYLTLAAVLATASACDRTPATAPGAQPSVPPRERITERPPDGAMSGQELSRRNTPWRGMSDQELAQQISEARGHVLIGFKAIGALEGVNDSGRVLVDAATVRSAVQQVRALGAKIEREYDMPFIAATVPAQLVARLRALPFIEYIEPVVPGQWHAQDTTWNLRNVNAPAAWS